MTLQAEIQGYYDSYSTWYENERRAGYYELINDLETEMVLDAAKGADVLEIGVGTGLILERVAQVARVAVGIDLSLGMATFSHEEKKLTTAQATADILPFPDNSFDVVYSMKVLAHVPNIDNAISEIHRVLRPDGRAYLEFYNPRSFKFLANRIEERIRGSRSVFIRYDTFADVARLTSKKFTIGKHRGVRIAAPSRHFYTLPGLGRITRRVDRIIADLPPLSRLGGYLVVELIPDGR